jgi:hypothetical protein
MYIPSSKYRLGNPIGFQKCVNADNARGINKNKVEQTGRLLRMNILINYQYNNS